MITPLHKCWIVVYTYIFLVCRVLQSFALRVSNCVRPVQMHREIDTALTIYFFGAWLVWWSDGMLILGDGLTMETTPCVLLVLCQGQARQVDLLVISLTTVSFNKVAHSIGRPAWVSRNTKPIIATVAANDQLTSWRLYDRIPRSVI